jgi:putative ABC transport system permease protein
MQTVLKNVQYALRAMVRDRACRAFAAAALLTLSIGIGATIAVCAIVYGVLLRPLPYPEPDRLVRAYEEHHRIYERQH